MRPLDGIVVLDLTRFLPGAKASMMLADFGAEVIKIEKPGDGDPARHIRGGSRLFQTTNRGKKSVAINLKDERGKQLFLKMASNADIVIESFRPNVMTRLGIGYKELRRSNPRLIYAALTGYGQTGPYAKMAGHDINYIALSGFLELTSTTDGVPLIPEIQVADIAAGSLQVVIGILLALQHRQRTGCGQRVDVSMVAGMAGLLALPLSALREGERPPDRTKGIFSGAYACYQLYRARDDRWLAVGALEPQFWANLCRELQREDLIPDQFSSDPRQNELKKELGRIFRERTSEEWFALLRERDCCVTPVRTLQEAVATGQFETDSGIELSLVECPMSPSPAPLVGEHSIEMIERLGVPGPELRVLENDRVVQTTYRNE